MKSILISVTQLEDGFIVVDGLGREHRASDSAGVGRLVQSLLKDPSIPAMTAQPQSQAVGLMARVARSIVRQKSPQHERLVDIFEPVAHQLTSLIEGGK